MSGQILIVDDEPEIADLLEVYLGNEGFEIHKFYNGTDALEYIKHGHIDMALLDVMLPDIDGFKLLQTIREEYFFPVIMLTAKVADMDKIKGLTLGADDYITKPFNPLEVCARVKTQIRRFKRYNHQEDAEVKATEEFDINGLYINKETHLCSLYGKEVKLTPIEFSILWYLCQHADVVVPSEELFEKVWGEKYYESSNNTVMAHIGRLREKLMENSKHPKFIQTVWGIGYKIESK